MAERASGQWRLMMSRGQSEQWTVMALILKHDGQPNQSPATGRDNHPTDVVGITECLLAERV